MATAQNLLFSTLKESTNLTKSPFSVCPEKPTQPNLPPSKTSTSACSTMHKTEQWMVKLLCRGCKIELQTWCKNHRFQTHAMYILQHFNICTRQEGHHHQMHFTGVLDPLFQMTESSLLLVTTPFFKFWSCVPQEFSNKHCCKSLWSYSSHTTQTGLGFGQKTALT